jgi:phospholipid/cholesterol/gamma-HCH transport system ATP-binding protein
MLFQGAALFDSLTVAENVAFVLRRQRRCSEEEIRRRTREALEMVELPGIEDKKPAALSGGMRKRVGLARAIVYQPEILLFDEPTTGLDPVVADSIDRLIVSIRDRLKVTAVAVTHDMRSAARIGQRILMLHQGRIQFSGTPEEVFHATDPVVRRFVNGISDPKEQTG